MYRIYRFMCFSKLIEFDKNGLTFPAKPLSVHSCLRVYSNYLAQLPTNLHQDSLRIFFLQGPELIQTAASITLPDDCVIGFIITHLLNVSLIHSDVMHSGAVDLSHITEDDFFNLVTINVHFSKSSIQDKNAESTAEKTLANSTTVQFNETNAPKTIKSFELVQRLHKTFLKHLHT